VPKGDEPNRKDSYIPDGDFEDSNGRMDVGHIERKIFEFKLKDGQFPQEQKMMTRLERQRTKATGAIRKNIQNAEKQCD